MENETCPCCGRHCPLTEPHCERGREYAKTGVIPTTSPLNEGDVQSRRIHGEHDGHCGHGEHKPRCRDSRHACHAHHRGRDRDNND